ncbi:hypothetical protein WJX73_007808 [Symbiochloris irregularis]|uniref:ACT domain-containing protein n=1 Tax=Symbiochloris irregularis TaxID=706552 RepID=A0AAW1NSN5_9CHLO
MLPGSPAAQGCGSGHLLPAALPQVPSRCHSAGVSSSAPCPLRRQHHQSTTPAAQQRSFVTRAAQEAVATVPTTTPTDTQKDFDVYSTQQPLDEGEEKHIISVFVADEAGIINRVAGVFARRGANIESLAVGLTIDKALFTIETSGTPRNVANLVKQLSKLLKVRNVEDITACRRVERELVLCKVRAAPGASRTEVMQLTDIFRARVVDVSDVSLTICATGDAGKTYALQRSLAKFGIIELARTGKICLKRGEELLEMGGWGEGIVPRLRKEAPKAEEGPDTREAASPGDVYDVTSAKDDEAGVWEVDNLLQARHEGLNEFEAHTLSITVADIPGVLNHVTAVFARRGYNVQSLAVGHCEAPGCSRITMVVPGTDSGVANLIKQLLKLIYVQKVENLGAAPAVNREIMLVKVKCNAAQRREITDIADIFHGSVCDVSLGSIMLEIVGKEDKMAAAQTLLAPYGILEIARTGRVSLARDSRVNTRLLGRMKSNAVNRPVY